MKNIIHTGSGSVQQFPQQSCSFFSLFFAFNDWKHPQILHHNLVLICFLLPHQGQAPTWCLHWWVGEWLSAALHGGAAWCQGDTRKRKGGGGWSGVEGEQEGLPPSLHTQATICSQTFSCGRQHLLFTSPYGSVCTPSKTTANTSLTVNWGCVSAGWGKPLQFAHALQRLIINVFHPSSFFTIVLQMCG